MILDGESVIVTQSQAGSKPYAAVLVGAYSIDVIVGQAALSGYVDEVAVVLDSVFPSAIRCGKKRNGY